MKKILLHVLMVAFAVDECLTYQNSSHVDFEISSAFGKGRPTSVLSRRKRFIVFPDGSSFQLVFCAQNQGYINIGDIFWFGNTAALAWELPTDPQMFHDLKGYKKYQASRRNEITSNIYYLDDTGKVISKVPYRRKILVNPAFAKRSVDSMQQDNEISMNNAKIKKMHDEQVQRNHLKCKNKSDCNIEFHRETRKSLYGKLEKFFDALGWKGRDCVLRMLCEYGRASSEQESFLNEIMRAVFTLQGGKEFTEVQHKAYDIAHSANGDCSQLYQECENSLTGEQLF